jgi:hypothetical protein
VTGAVYQNTTGGPIIIDLPITGTVASTAQWALGPTDTPPDFGGATTVLLASVVDKSLVVPNGWYWSITSASTTLGTASVLGS